MPAQKKTHRTKVPSVKGESNLPDCQCEELKARVEKSERDYEFVREVNRKQGALTLKYRTALEEIAGAKERPSIGRQSVCRTAQQALTKEEVKDETNKM